MNCRHTSKACAYFIYEANAFIACWYNLTETIMDLLGKDIAACISHVYLNVGRWVSGMFTHMQVTNATDATLMPSMENKCI